MSTNDFIGLSKRAAQNLAEKRNLIFRLCRVDGEKMLSHPTDYMKDRVSIEIDGGKVTKAVSG